MGVWRVIGVIALATTVAACGVPRAPSPAAEVESTPAAPLPKTWDRARFLAFAEEEPLYAAWIEAETWLSDAKPYAPAQPAPLSPLALPAATQRTRGVLQWQPMYVAEREGLTVDLRPGTVAALQTLRRDLPTVSGVNGHVTAAAVVDAKTRTSRVVLIWGTDARHWDAGRTEVLLEHRGAAFTGFTFDRRRARLYVLDAHGWQVWRVDDTNGDRVPDTVASRSVVPKALFRIRPHGMPPLSISWVERDGLRGLLPVPGSLHAGALWGTEPDIQGEPLWADSDDDGVMETLATWSAR